MAGPTTTKTIKLRIGRYRPERSGEPFYQEFTIPFRDDMVVLDALNYIKDHIDPTAGWEIAYAAADLPASAPNTRHSLNEFEPRRFAPLIDTHAASPAANKPGVPVNAVMSV